MASASALETACLCVKAAGHSEVANCYVAAGEFDAALQAARYQFLEVVADTKKLLWQLFLSTQLVEINVRPVAVL
jgi:hypothetical protein